MRVATRPSTSPAASTTNHPPPCSISSVSRPRGTYVRICSVTPFHVETNVNNKGEALICQREFKHGIGKDHRIPLAELKCMSPKRVKELDLYLGCAARRR